ncbi:MAG: gamma-glutamyl-gamma-aminobutyrate hydrolase family protein [Sedimentisphaerales bacterium]|nr:gamma-glutamyl-gamma-aminobutyrate hydrolase family protein [Sedimentisphaerales bacterium]
MRRMKWITVFIILPAVFGCGQSQHHIRPVIGITSVYQGSEDGGASAVVNFAYVRAIEENGGVPVILPTVTGDEAIERYVTDLDGLVLIGGDDIPPQAYGEQPHPATEVLSEQRYDFERRLIAKWFETKKPMLGVCLGMQFVNVVRGGSLVQDIPSQIGTTVTHRGKNVYHEVTLEPGCRLANLLKQDRANVLSYHHQAVKKVGGGLRAVARSDDGVVEALERTDGTFGLFVQWHPESMMDRTHRDAVYGALVAASRQK